MKLYIPASLNIPFNKHFDKISYILDVIYRGRFNKKGRTADDYIPLSSRILIKIIGNNYSEFIKWLITNRVIELLVDTNNKKFKIGKRSKSYRFTAKYRYGQFKSVEIQDSTIIKNIQDFQKENEALWQPEHHYIFECLKNVEYDSTNALKYIETTISNPSQLESYYYHHNVFSNEHNQFYQTVKLKSGRVYNNLTNLPKKLRKFLSYQGKPLVELDISNSQPFLLAVLSKQYIENTTHSSIQTSEYINDNTSYVSYLSSIYTSNYKNVDFYSNLTSKGMLYQFLKEELNLSYDEEKLKKWIFINLLYGKNYYDSPKIRLFKQTFPIIAEVINEYKKDDYKNLSIQLQKKESEIIIGKIIPQLANLNLYALTIHDCIVTTYDNEKIVKKIILDTFNEQYGLIPKVKTKRAD